MSEWILYDVADGVCTITMNRPEKKNAMSFAMLSDFIAAFARAGEDDEALVVVLKGTAGLSVQELTCQTCLPYQGKSEVFAAPQRREVNGGLSLSALNP